MQAGQNTTTPRIPTPWLVGWSMLAMAVAVAFCWLFMLRTQAIGLDGAPVVTLFDDGMISMRYAHMLVQGHGLVWNPGEAVEGYTNPLWTLIMAAVIATTGPMAAPGVVILLGGLCAGLSSLLAFMLGWHVAVRAGLGSRWVRGAAGMAGAFVLLYYPYLYWSFGGMEVGPLAVLALALMLLLHTHWNTPLPPRAAWLCGLLAVLAYGLRPDAVLLVGIPLAARVLVALQARDTASLQRLMLVAAGCALLIAAHLLGRHSFYGAWVPNTYVLKMEGWVLAERLAAGWAFVTIFLNQSSALALLAVGFMARGQRSFASVAVLGAATAVGYQAWIGGDPWPYWRQLAPAVLVAVAVMIPLALAALPARWRWVVPVWMLFCILSLNSPFGPEIIGREKPYSFKYHQDNLTMVQALQRIIPPTETLAVTWAGVIPYYWPGPVTDILGKSDTYIAHLPAHRGEMVGHNKYDLNYTASKRPAYMQQLTWSTDTETSRRNFYTAIGYRGTALFIRNDLMPTVMERAKLLP